MNAELLTTPALLAAAVDAWGEREALVDRTPEAGPVRLSFQDLDQRVRRVARSLMHSGVQPGDRVAVWAPNIWEWPVVALGIQHAGAVLVPLNTRYKGSEAAYILEASGAVALFCVEGFLGNRYVSMLDGQTLPGLRVIVNLRGDTPAKAIGFDEWYAAGIATTEAALEERINSVSANSTADILFTSGTTGAPKGVVCEHHQTVRAFKSWADIVGLQSTDRYLIVNPFFHAFGYKAGLVACLHSGATMVPEPVFDVASVMESIRTESISMIPGPPTLYQTILNDPALDPAALGTLRLAVTGAAAVPVSLIESMRSVLGFETVITGYGLTEACGIATMCRHDDPDELISATSGRAIPDVEVAVVDDSGAPLPPGEAGEVVVRGYNVMQGYFNDAAQTAEVIDAEGWLHTGDVGVMDAGGNLAITDRIKDMLIVGGFNVYPAEIEKMLVGRSDIAQAAVVGVTDERMGEVGYAFVVPAVGETIVVEDLLGWCRAEMANFKVPRHIEVVPALPTNASGKVLKYELREQAHERLKP